MTATEEATCTCPVCGGAVTGDPIVEVGSTPVNSVVILHDADDARAFPCGRIELVVCDTCGFSWNRAFDLDLVHYGEGYESTQAFSAVFNAYHAELADRMVADHHLTGATVVEIGCGQGEFLHLLHDRGVAVCLGYDPAFDPAREGTLASDGVEVVASTFQDASGLPESADLVCCKMTLEHIPAVARFLRDVRSRVTNEDTTVMFQVPNFSKIVDDGAFWDVYYEHCSYFTDASLRNAFALAGFEITRTWTEYDEQYLFAEAKATEVDRDAPLLDPTVERERIDAFAERTAREIEHWSSLVRSCSGPVVLWGGGSKAVAVLAAMGADAERVVAAVDINPLKHDTFLPGSGIPVIGPDRLPALDPELIVLMNPVYTAEVLKMLDDIGLGRTRLEALGAEPVGHTST